MTQVVTLVKVRVKPEHREEFLKAIEHDALHSESDEAGCCRFNVIQTEDDPNVFYFYEVYKDEAARQAHRATPHFKVWTDAADTLDGAVERVLGVTVFPADPAYWGVS